MRAIASIILLAGAALLAALPAWAQTKTCGEFQLAEIQKKYKVGRFQEVLADANACLINGFETNKQKEEALAVLAKTYIELNQFDQAAQSVSDLLKLNANYEAASADPGLFKKIIADLKQASIAQTVTSVSKKAENVKEAPATVMVITERDIRERGYTDLEQLFSDLPGFDISRTYSITYSNLYQRGYRSDNTDRTLLLVDGVEDNDLWSGGVYLARQYPITNIKRVEVVYGPASTMYGANAFLGVVNIVTKDDQSIGADRRVSANAELGYGSYNTRYADLTLLLRQNNVSASLTARRFYSEEMDLSDYPEFDFNPADYDQTDYSKLLNVTSGAASFARRYAGNAEFERLYQVNTGPTGDTTSLQLTTAGAQRAAELDKAALQQNLGGKPVRYSNLTDHWLFYGKLKVSDFTLGFHAWQSENGTANYYHDNLRAGSANGSIWQPKQSFVYLRYEKELSSQLSVQNLAQYMVSEVGDDTKTIELYNYANRRLTATHLLAGREGYWTSFYSSVVSKQFRNELKVNYTPISKLNLVSGLEIRNSMLQGDYRITASDSLSAIELGTTPADTLPGGNNYHIADWGYYLQASYELMPWIKLNLGGRYDYNRIRVSGGYGSQISPRAAVVATPGKFILKAIYAQAFQNASVLKKFSTTAKRAANPTLEPELARNLEFSFGYQYHRDHFFDLVLYRAWYDGIASVKDGLALPGGKTQQFQAIGQVQVQGVQASWNGRWRMLNYFANYTYTDPRNNKVAAGELTGEFERVGDIASHRFNLGVSAALWKYFNLHLRANYVGDRPVGPGTSVAANPGLPETPGLFPATTIFSGALAVNDLVKGLSIQLIGQNLLDTEYFDPGIRSANISTYAYRTPQRRLNYILRLNYQF